MVVIQQSVSHKLLPCGWNLHWIAASDFKEVAGTNTCELSTQVLVLLQFLRLLLVYHH